MPGKPEPGKLAAALAEQRARQERSYREQALKLFPHVCGRCGREFEGRRLKELTVHHKDHNHDNNPPDGSNWELLCIYCHDNEHQRHIEADAHGPVNKDAHANSTHRPFANLADLLKVK